MEDKFMDALPIGEHMYIKKPNKVLFSKE